MTSDEKMGVLLSFSFPLCIGLICGLLIFNPSDGFVTWFASIDWGAQGVANVGAWVAGIATSLAALATASAARSSAKAAEAATQSANQWKLHASYDKYIDTGVKARIKLRWIEAHLNHMCENRFQVFFEQGSNFMVDSNSNGVDDFLSCLKPEFSSSDSAEVRRFNQYKEKFKFQSERINEIYPDTFNIVEETYELSKNHVGLSNIEKDVILKAIEEFMSQIKMIAHLYEAIIDSSDVDDRTKKVHIDSSLNCNDSSRHYYRSTISNLKLITGYIDCLVIDSDLEKWNETKLNHIAEEQDIFRLITKDNGGYSENVISSIELKFGRL
ncbi:hypothetical protein AB4486_07595 [Vibrio sp. 10N.222.55.C6]|uniref:hypothetical protein n=1 Tax=Vibrio sp. 10N.222.55.C6 TaxID=3229649 RepID=UPI003552DFAB